MRRGQRCGCRETLPTLEWAARTDSSWKFSYLKAVLLAAFAWFGACRALASEAFASGAEEGAARDRD